MQGQGVLHVPTLTPLQQLAHAARRERLERFSPRPLPEVVHAIEDIGPAPEVRKPTFHEVDDVQKVRMIQRAAVHFHPEVSLDDLVSKRRTKDVVIPRQIAMYLCKSLTRRSFPDIGRRFGGRDHTTVLHAAQKVERLVATDPYVAKKVESIKALLEEGI